MKTSIDRVEALLFSARGSLEFFGTWLLIAFCRLLLLIVPATAAFFVFGLRLLSHESLAKLPIPVQEAMGMYVSTPLSFKLIAAFVVLILVFMFFIGIIAMGTTKLGFAYYDKKKPLLSELFSCSHLAFRHLIAQLIYLALFFVGLSFFVVPGIYCGVRLFFYCQVLVEKECSALEALAISWRMTQGQTALLFGFQAVIFCAVSVVFTSGLGAMFVMPLILLNTIYAYRRINA